MHDREDVNPVWKYEVDDSISANENLPDFASLVIGNKSSDARKLFQLPGGIEDAIRK